jgi:hypothetical protein
LLADLRRILFEKTSKIENTIHRTAREERSSDPWIAFRDICDTILPTLGTALGVCISVRMFDISTSTLKRISYWDLPGTRRSHPVEETDLVSLRRGQRGINASTFHDAEKSSLYVDDVSKLKSTKSAGIAPYLAHRETTVSQYCHKLFFRSVPIGTINFESSRIDGIPFQLQKQLAPFIEGLETYLREFLVAQDADWLSLTAAAYDNLHELTQTAETGPTIQSSVVLQAISKFEQAALPHSRPLSEFQRFLESEIPAKLRKVPALARKSIEREARLRCRFDVIASAGLQEYKVSATRIELLKRIFRNLLSNFPIGGGEDSHDTFTVVSAVKPFPSIRFRQVQSKPFDEGWLGSIGYRPISRGSTDRLHHDPLPNDPREASARILCEGSQTH